MARVVRPGGGLGRHDPAARARGIRSHLVCHLVQNEGPDGADDRLPWLCSGLGHRVHVEGFGPWLGCARIIQRWGRRRYGGLTYPSGSRQGPAAPNSGSAPGTAGTAAAPQQGDRIRLSPPEADSEPSPEEVPLGIHKKLRRRRPDENPPDRRVLGPGTLDLRVADDFRPEAGPRDLPVDPLLEHRVALG